MHPTGDLPNQSLCAEVASYINDVELGCKAEINGLQLTCREVKEYRGEVLCNILPRLIPISIEVKFKFKPKVYGISSLCYTVRYQKVSAIIPKCFADT